tara:strand:+ start:972 stop:1394 length:423 start_codon:yes stop_codon:yes gene_type:complete
MPDNDKRGKQFSAFIAISYGLILAISILVALTTYFSGLNIIPIITLGIICPMLYSVWNCIITNWIAHNKESIMLEYNLVKFLISIGFILLMVQIGVNWLHLNQISYVLTLVGFWFVFHMIEAFYASILITKRKLFRKALK